MVRGAEPGSQHPAQRRGWGTRTGPHHQDGSEGAATAGSPGRAPCFPSPPVSGQPPSPAGAPPRPLTAAGVVVGVAHAEVAPAVLHAVAPVGALRVHVAGCGRDFCGERGSPVSSSRGRPGQRPGCARPSDCAGAARSGTSGPAPPGATDGGSGPGDPSPDHSRHLNPGSGAARGRAPTEFAEKPEEAGGALAEGGIGPQAPAPVAALTVLGGSCHGEREEPPLWGRWGPLATEHACARARTRSWRPSRGHPQAHPALAVLCAGCLHAPPPRNPSPRPPRTVAAVAAREPFGALAHVARVRVHAGARVLARRREAGVGRRGASCKKDSGHQGRRHSSRGHLCARAEQVEAWGLLHSSLPRGAPKARGGRGLEMRPPAHLLAKPGLFQTPSCCFFLG